MPRFPKQRCPTFPLVLREALRKGSTMAAVEKAPGKHVRWIVWMLIALPLILLSYLALLATSFFDSRPKEYPELALPPRPPGSKTFGEVYNEILARNPQWTPDRERDVYYDARIFVRRSLSDPSSFDASKIKVFIEEAEKSVGILRELSAYPGPWAREDPEVLAKNSTALAELRRLINELFLLALAGQRHGIPAPALPEAARLGLQTCVTIKPTVSDFIGGFSYNSATEHSIMLAAWALHTRRPKDEQLLLLREFQDLISRCELEQEMTSLMIRSDFAVGRAMKSSMQIRSLLWADESDLELTASFMGGGQTPMKLRWQGLRTQPNRMDELFAQLSLYCLAQSRLPYIERKPWSAPTPPSVWSLGPNAGGHQFFSSNASDSVVLLRSFDHYSARVRLMIVLCAIARHRLEHDGALPSELADLVPTYLDHVPRDPFNGNPMAYDPVSGKIWCTGEDGKTDASSVADPEAASNLGPPGLEAIFSGQRPEDQVVELRKFFVE